VERTDVGPGSLKIFGNPAQEVATDEREIANRAGYKFTSAGHSHTHIIHDWEVQATYRHYKHRYGSKALAHLVREYSDNIHTRNLPLIHLHEGRPRRHFRIVVLAKLSPATMASCEAGEKFVVCGAWPKQEPPRNETAAPKQIECLTGPIRTRLEPARVGVLQRVVVDIRIPIERLRIQRIGNVRIRRYERAADRILHATVHVIEAHAAKHCLVREALARDVFCCAARAPPTNRADHIAAGALIGFAGGPILWMASFQTVSPICAGRSAFRRPRFEHFLAPVVGSDQSAPHATADRDEWPALPTS
jgi:hypothetical protein